MNSGYFLRTSCTWLKNNPFLTRSQNSSAWSTIAIYCTFDNETRSCRRICHIRIDYVVTLGKRETAQMEANKGMNYHITVIMKTEKCLNNIIRNLHLPQNWSLNWIISKFVGKLFLWQTWEKATCLKRGRYLSNAMICQY